MANHAYIVTAVIPKTEQVDAIVRRVVAEKFPMLTVNFDSIHNGGLWTVCHPADDSYFTMNFWMGSYYLTKEECKIPHVEIGKGDGDLADMVLAFAVEFRHGYGYDILWWIEHEIREAIGRELGGWMFDDGVGEIGKPDEKTYSSFYEYKAKGWKTAGFVQKAAMKLSLKLEKKDVPEDVRKLYGV